MGKRGRKEMGNNIKRGKLPGSKIEREAIGLLINLQIDIEWYRL